MLLLQGPLWKPLELNLVRSHVQGGIGHYHLFLLQLQLDYKLDLRGVVDFPMLMSEDKLKKGKSSVCIVTIYLKTFIFVYSFTNVLKTSLSSSLFPMYFEEGNK